MLRGHFSAVLITAISILIISQCLDKRIFRTKFAISTLLLLLPATWLFIDSLSGNGLNYATLYHLRTGLAGAGIADFKNQIIRFLGTAFLAVLIAGIAAWIAVRFARKSQAAMMAYATSAIAILAFNPLSQDLFRLTDRDSGDSSKVSKEYIKPSAGSDFRNKNIVVIYAESLERTYFDQKAFPGLTPNLIRLSDEGLDYTDVRPIRGTGWTIAGIVASMCGVPLTVWRAEDGNQLGRINRFLPGSTCLTDWLASNGYDLEFMGGADSEFAGKAKFLSAHGFSTIRDSEYFRQMQLPPNAFSSWGLHDDILLEQAAMRFEQLSAQNTPFLLSVLTLDTHHPSGHVPAACGDMKYTGLDESYPILDAVACSDLLISRFVDRIRSGPHAANTVIVLASDHLGMPNDARDIISAMNDERRNMLLVFDTSIKPQKIDFPATTVDTGAILLSMLGGNDSLGFGRVPSEHPKDGLSKATVSKADTSDYHSYAQSLWQLGETPWIQLLKSGQLQVGSQKVPPPLSLIMDNNGIVKELSLEANYKEFTGGAENWIHITHCAAFKAGNPTDWCALESKPEGKQYLYNQTDLLDGVNLSAPAPEAKRVHLAIGSDYIVRTRFEDDFPQLVAATAKHGSVFSNLAGGVLFNGPFVPITAGDYHISIMGSASGAKAAWADVIAASGKTVLSRGPLRSADTQSYEIYSANLHLENDAKDIEVRVYADRGEAVRVDSFTLMPMSNHPVSSPSPEYHPGTQ